MVSDGRPKNELRRRVLGLGAAGAGALAATLIRDGRAEAHGALHETSATGDPAIHGDNTGPGPGVVGSAAQGAGVVGVASGVGAPGVRGHHEGTQIGPGVFGESDSGAGVFGRGTAGPGVVGHVVTGNAPGVAGNNDGGGPGVHGVASALGSPGVAGRHQGAQIGPGIFGESESGAGVFGRGTAGPGVVGHVVTGNAPGVAGNNDGGGPGVSGVSAAGPGVLGRATGAGLAGVAGHHFGSLMGPGVHGDSENGPGVRGFSVAGTGVAANSEAGIGLAAGSLNGIGVSIHSGNTALRVTGGRSKFNSVGDGAIGAGADQVFVPNAMVTAASHITLTLTTDPQRDTAVQWIERSPGTGFAVHLTRSVRSLTRFTYFIVEPAFP